MSSFKIPKFSQGQKNKNCKRSFEPESKSLNLSPLFMMETDMDIQTTFDDFSSNCLATINIPEVLEQVFKYLDVKQLKTCRFVNPAWNHEACRALQKKSHVFLHEDSARSNELLELMVKENKMETGVSTPAVTPFKRFHVSVDTFADEIMNNVINRDDSCIVELYMNKPPLHNQSNFQENLNRILVKNSGCLRYLRVALKDGINLGWPHTQDQNHKLYLPALQDFGFWEYHHNHHLSDKSASIDFLIDIINAAPNLIQICSSSSDPSVVSEILTRANLTNLENIYIESITGRHIQQLSMLQLPKLKSLILQSEIATLPDQQKVSSTTLQNLVRNFSISLEELNISWISDNLMVDDDFPFCPNLQKLSIDGWYGSLGVFDSHRLPKLESILIVDHHECEDSIYNPHEGVTSIIVECPQGVSLHGQGFYTDDEFDSFLFYIRRQFPNARSLDLTMPLTDESIRSVIRNFPNLETLILDTKSELSSHLFTGRNQLILKQFLEEGYNLDEIAILPSIRDLPCLKKLVVGRYTKYMYPEGLILTNEMIQYGIAEMPSLETFQLNWNPELSVDVFSENLWHLNKIIINNSSDLQVQEAMVQLTGSMYQVILESNTL